MGRTIAGAVALGMTIVAASPSLHAQSLFLLNNDGSLSSTTISNPAARGATVPVVGLVAGDTLVSIDVRPQNQRLYGLGVNATANTVQIYALAPETGQATAIGTPQSYVDTNGDPVDLPTSGYDMDFNPAVDRIRVVTSSGLNFRLNPNNGAAVDGNAGVAGVNTDGAINGATTTVNGTAYANSQPNQDATAPITTQYTLDAATNSLYIQNPPNNGTQSAGVAVSLGGNQLDFSGVRGFDIPPGVNAAASNGAATGLGYAIFEVNAGNLFHSVDLTTGVATQVGALDVRAFAIRPDLGAAVALSADGTALLRFNPATPATTVSVAIGAGLAAGETLVAIDSRPATGQLFGLAVNATANTASLYVIDPQGGAPTVVGAQSGIAFVDAAGAPVDLPDASAGYGFDFNPTVDRIRVVTGSGLNFRLNPVTGGPVDGSMVDAGTNPDAAINGLPNGSTGVQNAAYTNSFGQPLTGGMTSQYTIDSASNTLFIVNTPNAGTLTLPVPVTLNGAVLDFGSVGGFDIPAGVRVTTSATRAFGNGFAALTVGAVTSLYSVNLTTGAAVSAGTLGAGTTGVSGLVIWGTRPEVLVNDAITVTNGATRIYPLANDSLDGTLTITDVSNGAITIDGRSLIIPDGFTGTFTYTISNGVVFGTGSITVTAGTPLVNPTTFNGLLSNAAGDIAGWATVAISTKRVATIQVLGGAQSVRAKITIPTGQQVGSVFSSIGNLTLELNNDGTVDLTLAALGGDVAGTLQAALTTSTVQKYHIAISSLDAAIPGGGFAIANVGKNGTVSLSGLLPDGGKFTAGTTIRDNGTIAFYSAKSGSKPPAVFGGELVTANLATSDVTGELFLFKLPQAPGTKGLHLGGLDTVLTATGSLYEKVLNLAGPGTLTLTGGNLAATQSGPVTVTANIPAVPTGALVGWSGGKASTGTFKAKVTVPGIAKPVTGSGVYLPKSRTAWGFFPGTTVGGSIELTVPPAP